jgi:hypothetical protein
VLIFDIKSRSILGGMIYHLSFYILLQRMKTLFIYLGMMMMMMMMMIIPIISVQIAVDCTNFRLQVTVTTTSVGSHQYKLEKD